MNFYRTPGVNWLKMLFPRLYYVPILKPQQPEQGRNKIFWSRNMYCQKLRKYEQFLCIMPKKKHNFSSKVISSQRLHHLRSVFFPISLWENSRPQIFNDHLKIKNVYEYLIRKNFVGEKGQNFRKNIAIFPGQNLNPV